MTKDCNCKKPYTVESIHDVDIDDLATIPDYFIGVREVTDPSTGNNIMTPVRIPGARVMPTGNLANVTAIVSNNETIDIPERQVRAGYIDVQPGGNIVKYADETHAAMFLMVSNYTNGKVLIQSNGFLTIPNGHQYIPATQYFVGESGTPVTDNASGQKLFIPLDDTTLMINGDF